MKRGAVRAAGVDGALGSNLGQQARGEKPGQEAMNRGAVRPDGGNGGLRSGVGQQARGEKPEQDPMKRGAVRADGVDGGLRSGPGQDARVERLGQEALKRGAVRPDGVDGGLRSGPGQDARVERLGQEAMNRDAVRADGVDGGLRSGPGQDARVEKPGQEPVNRDAVRPDGVDGGLRSGPGQDARVERLGQEAMKRGAVRAGGLDGALGSNLGQEARGEKPGQDAMKRGAVRADGVDGGLRLGPGQDARIERPGQDPMMSLPPGACPGGGAVRPDGTDGGSRDRAVPRGIAGTSPAVDCPGLGSIDCGTARRRGRQSRMLRRTLLAAAVPAALATPALIARARAAPTSFEAFLVSMRTEARRAGIAAATLDRAFAGLTPNQGVIDRDRHQPEFTLTWARYRALVISDQRIANGRAAWQANRALLARIEDRYGVSPGVIMGIWGLESSFGTELGGFHVVQALATLAWEGRRAAFFRTELLAALRILDHGDVSPARMTGSYAGAMGQPQFMPSAYLRYAVDFEGNGRRDIWTSTPDTLASIACYLADSGWRPGGSWGQKVTLPADFPTAESGRAIRKPVGEWLRRGVGSADGRRLAPPEADAALILPDGPGGEAFLAYGNFAAIRRYNPSDFYAIAVGLIGDGITL
jgi:membrane-bound lytic murein transglycosylase B